MLGGFLLLRRAMLDELGGFDPGFRLYGEDIDLCYRAAQAGWERWYVPAAVVHARVRPGRATGASSTGARSGTGAGSSASCASTPSGCGRPVSSRPRSTTAQAERWTETAYADPAAYLAHRAELVVALGPRLAAGDVVLDLACGDGGPRRAPAPARRRLPRRRRERGDGRGGAPPARRPGAVEPATSTTTSRRSRSPRRPSSARSTTRDDRAAFFRRAAALHRATKLVFDLNPRQYPARGRARATCARAGFDGVELRPFFPAAPLAAAPARARCSPPPSATAARPARAPLPLHLPRRGLPRLEAGSRPPRRAAASRRSTGRAAPGRRSGRSSPRRGTAASASGSRRSAPSRRIRPLPRLGHARRAPAACPRRSRAVPSLIVTLPGTSSPPQPPPRARSRASSRRGSPASRTTEWPLSAPIQPSA